MRETCRTREIRSIAVAAILALVLAGPAFAVSLSFAGDLSIEIETFPAIGVAGSGIARINGSANAGHLNSLSIDADAFQALHVEIPVDIPGSPIVGMLLTAANQAGSFSGSGGAGFGGAMPLAGVMKLCTYPSPCSAAVANFSVPLSIGTDATVVFTGAVNMTVVGAPWTTGTAIAGTATRMGGVAPLSSTGATSGSITLVTPIFISSNLSTAG